MTKPQAIGTLTRSGFLFRNCSFSGIDEYSDGQRLVSPLDADEYGANGKVYEFNRRTGHVLIADDGTGIRTERTLSDSQVLWVQPTIMVESLAAA